jgi:hypothetical protein
MRDARTTAQRNTRAVNSRSRSGRIGEWAGTGVPVYVLVRATSLA